MIRDRENGVGSGKGAEAIGIEALSFLASDPDLLQRFLDLSGLLVEHLRMEARRPAFFVGLLDFILAHEPTVMDFAASAGINPVEVGAARDQLAEHNRLKAT